MKSVSQSGTDSLDQAETSVPDDAQYLRMLGESIRSARARRGMTRKMLAAHSAVSERFLARLESGTGNASILVLRRIAEAFDVTLSDLLPQAAAQSAELGHTVELLRRLAPADLDKARELLLKAFNTSAQTDRYERIALIGLRGAGKSTVGQLLAEKLGVAFFELDRLIEQASGVSLEMIFDLYGQSGFRRFEHRCLEELLSTHRTFVVATGGSLVSEPATYDRLLSSCFTIWLRATPHEHMSRVIAQGDVRPMKQSAEAMSDLERILREREPLYRQADAVITTSDRSVDEVLSECMEVVNVRALSPLT